MRLAPHPFSEHASGGQLRLLVNTAVPIATMSMLRIVSRITGSLNASSRQLRRVSSGLSQHCFQLRLGEFLRLHLTPGLRVDTILSTGRAQAANSAGFRFGTCLILGFAVGGL
jgi:hypothetical protein